MDTVMSETEAPETFRSPPRRRRSTFFERRDSIVPQALPENVDPNIIKETESDEKHASNLTRYYSDLVAEKELWKKEVNSRKNKYHDIRQQYQMAAKAPSRSRISYSPLANEDIEFFKAKPNISKLVDSQLKLHKSVMETRALFRIACKLDDVVLNYCEKKVNDVTEYILENSTVEALE